jgi:hypothetical protein
MENNPAANGQPATAFTCPNCGAVADHQVHFCPECGQRNHDLKLPFRHIVEEIIESTLHFDTKSIKTLRLLLTRPGKLSSEFLAGKRQQFVPPVRLYIFTSFVFFFLISLSPGRHAETPQNKTATNRLHNSIQFYSLTDEKLVGLNDKQIDSLLAAEKIEPTAVNRYIAHQLAHIATSGMESFNHMLFRQISTMMFVLMPIFGVVIRLVNRKKLRYAIEGMVISIHLHTAFFIILTIMTIAGWFMDAGILLLLSPVCLGAYVVLTFRNIFRSSWWATFLKSVILGVIYILLLITLFSLMVLILVVIF